MKNVHRPQLRFFTILFFALALNVSAQDSSTSSNCYKKIIKKIDITKASYLRAPTSDTLFIHEDLICNNLLVERKSKTLWYSNDTIGNAKKRYSIKASQKYGSGLQLKYELACCEAMNKFDKDSTTDLISKTINYIYRQGLFSDVALQVSCETKNDSLFLSLESIKGKLVWYVQPLEQNKIQLQRLDAFYRNDANELIPSPYYMRYDSQIIEFDEYGTYIANPTKTILSYAYDTLGRIVFIQSEVDNIRRKEIIVETRTYN